MFDFAIYLYPFHPHDKPNLISSTLLYQLKRLEKIVDFCLPRNNYEGQKILEENNILRIKLQNSSCFL